MQGRVEQPDDHRMAVHGFEKSFEIASLHGQQSGQGGDPTPPAGGHDHLLDDRQSVFLEEHMLGPAEANALGAIAAGPFGVLGIIGVGPDTQAAHLIGPGQQQVQVGFAFEIRVLGFQLAQEDLAGPPVDADPVPLPHLDDGFLLDRE